MENPKYYWKCNCKKGFIHRRDQEGICPKCKASCLWAITPRSEEVIRENFYRENIIPEVIPEKPRYIQPWGQQWMIEPIKPVEADIIEHQHEKSLKPVINIQDEINEPHNEEIQVGDTVTVLRKTTRADWENVAPDDNWVYDMNTYIGRNFTVTEESIPNKLYLLGQYRFPAVVLKKVDGNVFPEELNTNVVTKCECGKEAPEESICELCDEPVCEDCQAEYNQFTQIDYNCHKSCYDAKG